MPKVPTGESRPQPGGSNIGQVERSGRVERLLVRPHKPMSTAWCGSALHCALVVTGFRHLSGTSQAPLRHLSGRAEQPEGGAVWHGGGFSSS